MKTRLCTFIFCLLALTGLCAAADAAEVTTGGWKNPAFLTNGKLTDYALSSGPCVLQVTDLDAPMASLYLLFDVEYGEYTVTNDATGDTVTAGTQGFLHEYLDLVKAFGGPVSSVTLHFSDRVSLSEVCAFQEGPLPDYVQQWQPPRDDGVDLLLLATHGDDDQLYFAGLLPTYAGERGYRVQVAYFTDHRNLNNVRAHEMLNGLWATGVRHYPVFGVFEDFRIDSKEKTYQRYETKYGRTRQELLGFVVEQLRRFRPQVVVGHDLEGEYGHGMHRVYADLLTQALPLSGDPAAYPEQAYGPWDVPKAYLHLYKENPIVMDYDTPLEAFDGLTAFQVTQKLGFPSHKSQFKYQSFRHWLYGEDGTITKASQIRKFSPCQFGLYRSLVGPDTAGNDFMENIVSYDQQALLEQQRRQTTVILLGSIAVCLLAALLLIIALRKKRRENN